MSTGTAEQQSGDDLPVEARVDAGEEVDPPPVEEIEHLLETFDEAITEAREAAG